MRSWHFASSVFNMHLSVWRVPLIYEPRPQYRGRSAHAQTSPDDGIRNSNSSSLSYPAKMALDPSASTHANTPHDEQLSKTLDSINDVQGTHNYY